MSRLLTLFLSIVIAAGVIGGAIYYRYAHPLITATQPTTLAATAPASRPTTVAIKQKPPRGPATQILDLLRDADPKYPTTQRLQTALDLKYAARITLADPLFLDNQGNLWITRADAPLPFNFLKAGASDTATHIVRDAVVFVLWDSTENGKWLPHLVVKNPAPAAGYQLVDYDGRRALPDPYGFDWSRALVLPGRRGEKERIVVPTASGACAFAFDDAPESILQNHQRLIDPATDKDAPDRAVQLVMDTSGVIAYVTNAAGNRGGKGVARFASVPATPDAPTPPYKWFPLTGWPDRLLHLVPLLDGSVLQIISAPPGDDPAEQDKVTFSLNSVAPVVIDEKKVYLLLAQLSASDPEQREEAFKSLTTYGPGIAPILEKSLEDQPVEAQIRIRQLLKNKIEPSLGSMSLVDGRMKVVNRLPDGGIIFYAEGGVAIPRSDDTPTYVTPAWLCVRPGRAAELLPPSLVTDLQPDKQRIIVWGLNDYVVLDPVKGPQWFLGNHLDPLLRKEHRQFTQFTGIDSTGRWIFRTPPSPPTQATTAPATTQTATTTQRSNSSLIIDPHLPDPTPRLPGWQLPTSAGAVGWDKNNWPVIFVDVQPKPVPWALEEEQWRVLDEKTESAHTDPAEIPTPHPPTRPTTTTTTASTGPATQDSALGSQDYLLTVNGDSYFDGRQALKVVHPDGSTTVWPLPESAIGTAKPTLLHTRDGLLFLYNEPGRIVRIRPTPDGDQPFNVEAVFTRTVPSDPTPLRVWLDPADRICFAHDKNRITVLFPQGRIPPAIAEKMRPEDFPPDEP